MNAFRSTPRFIKRWWRKHSSFPTLPIKKLMHR